MVLLFSKHIYNITEKDNKNLTFALFSGSVQPASAHDARVGRRQGNLEATVAVQQGGGAAVHRHVRMRDQEVRHLKNDKKRVLLSGMKDAYGKVRRIGDHPARKQILKQIHSKRNAPWCRLRRSPGTAARPVPWRRIAPAVTSTCALAAHPPGQKRHPPAAAS